MPICYAHVWSNNRLYTISRLLPAAAVVVSSYHNSKPSLVIVSTPALRLKSCQILPRDQSVHFKNTTVSKSKNPDYEMWKEQILSGIGEDPDKPKIFVKKDVRNHSYHTFYPVLAKIQINRLRINWLLL